MRKRPLQRTSLFGCERVRGCPALDGLGIQSTVSSRVQSREDDSIGPSVKQGEGKTLIASGVVKRTESHQPNVADNGWHQADNFGVLHLHALYRLSGTPHCSKVFG